MPRTLLTFALTVWMTAAAVTAVGAQPVEKQGAVGDSISTAMSANDQGLTFFNFFSRLTPDWRHNWTDGDLLPPTSESFRVRLQVGPNFVRRQENGARWNDALVQARGITDAGGVTFVTIEMGGNDVCRGLDDVLPSHAEMAAHINAAFGQLASNLAPGSTVMVAEVPDVVRLRDTTQLRSHIYFGNCQNLWDNFVFTFPCRYVLSAQTNSRGETPALRRQLARLFNEELNAEIAAQTAAWNDANGVRFLLSADTYEYQFTSAEVSRVDCFHPNRTGQGNLANRIWRGIGFNGVGYTPRIVHGSSWRGADGSFDARIHLSEPAAADLYISNCSDPNDPCFGEGGWSCWVGKTKIGSVLDMTVPVERPADSYSLLVVPHRAEEPPRYEDTYVTPCRGPSS